MSKSEVRGARGHTAWDCKYVCSRVVEANGPDVAGLMYGRSDSLGVSCSFTFRGLSLILAVVGRPVGK